MTEAEAVRTTEVASKVSEPRSWLLWGGRMTDRGRMHVVNHPRTVQAYGDDPVRVRVIEDPEGGHYGWLATDAEAPDLIQPHPGVYRMQFAYGPDAEEREGRGVTLRLRVEDVEAASGGDRGAN